MSDRALFEKFVGGDDRALDDIRKRYSAFVKSICKTVLVRSRLHSHLSYSYIDVVDELESVVWVEVYSSLLSGFRFENDDDLKQRFAAVATHRAKDRVRKSGNARMSGMASSTRETRKDSRATQGQATSTDQYRTFPSFYEISETEPDSLPQDYLSPEILNLGDDFIARLLEALSPSEQAVLDLTLDGMKQQTIAEELDLSVKTVYNRLESIRLKATKLQGY